MTPAAKEDAAFQRTEGKILQDFIPRWKLPAWILDDRTVLRAQMLMSEENGTNRPAAMGRKSYRKAQLDSSRQRMHRLNRS